MTLRYPDRDGEVSGVKFSPEHKWKYIRGLTPEEGVLIKWYVSFSFVSHHLLFSRLPPAFFLVFLFFSFPSESLHTTFFSKFLLLILELPCVIASIRNKMVALRFSHRILLLKTQRRHQTRR